VAAWVKVKLTQQQEFVIGGYTPPERSRKYFGALLVGYYGPEGLLFRRQSRHRLFRKGFRGAVRWHAEDQTYNLPLRKLAREEAGAAGPRDQSGDF
jgi:hypothetical protein